jgi:flagellar hook protein FlgE
MPFRIALSGLNASSSELRVIGNNIANASTNGFKKSRVEFSDIYPATNLGTSRNAIGAGVEVASVSQQFTQGNVDFTDNNLDLAVSGSGFFRLNDNGSIVYSRNGAFQVDRAGYVVNTSGYRLTAYQADTSGNITGAIDDLQLTTTDIPPNETTSLDMVSNLDSRAAEITAAFDATDPSTYNHSTSFTSYDSLGNPHVITLYFVHTDAVNREWNMYMSEGTPPTMVDADPGTAVGTGNNARLITFDATGALTSTATVTSDLVLASAVGANDFDIDINLSGTTQYGNNFSVASLVQDGYTTGRLSGIDIGETGVVQARYTNGQSRTLAQVVLANFSNPQGLQQLGETAWAETFDSGAALVGAAGTSSLGLVQSGALEGSNVDLTEQLVNMITAQRNFQANAQVISTADTITQTIINIR